eukprot:TRINITY_DN1830_c0_g2_i1.p1 TRINITY_DN1830_c0_g2~~TRINITY_DN1830_c0_g2_i1.p1  ORF type:complete len:281 (-),score=58.66 TRINITY_DN1830_c0_g2_i1:316-1158(-)
MATTTTTMLTTTTETGSNCDFLRSSSVFPSAYESRRSEDSEERIRSVGSLGEEASSLLEAAVESSLVEYVVDLFPNVPMDIILYYVRFAQITKKSQEYVVNECLQFCSLDAQEQQQQLQYFREQTLFVAEDTRERNASNDKNVRNSKSLVQQPAFFEDDIETRGKKKKKNSKAERIAQDVFNIVNEFRCRCEASPVRWDTRLAKAALRHSKNMAKKKVPAGHAGFQERARSIPYECYQVGENVAVIRGYKDVARVCSLSLSLFFPSFSPSLTHSLCLLFK